MPPHVAFRRLRLHWFCFLALPLPLPLTAAPGHRTPTRSLDGPRVTKGATATPAASCWRKERRVSCERYEEDMALVLNCARIGRKSDDENSEPPPAPPAEREAEEAMRGGGEGEERPVQREGQGGRVGRAQGPWMKRAPA